jgi:DNA-binding transcriptional regulator YiaG
VQWLPPGGPVFRWLLDHDQARQALTVAVRQGRMAPAEPPVAPAGEAPRSDPTTPAIPTPVLPEQRRQITGQFIRQVRESVGCTQATWAYIFGVSSRTIQHWETDRHQMRPRSAQILQQIITDPEGETHFRQRGLTLKLPDPDPSAPPESPPNGEPAPPSRRHPGSGNSGAVSAGSSAGTAPPRPPAR